MEAAEQVKFHELGATPLFRTVKGGVPQDTRLDVREIRNPLRYDCNMKSGMKSGTRYAGLVIVYITL